MRNCFVPGCDSICRGMSKRRMFTAPKDKECLNAWIAVLPKIRPFKVHDKVCERHFNQEDISTTYDNIINGLVYKIERGRAKLKPKAVPCRHLNVDIKSCAKRRKRKTSHPQIEKNVSVQIEQVKIDVQRNVEIEEVHDMQEMTAVECSSTTGEDTLIADEEQEEEHLESLEISQLQIQELFDTLYEDVYEVVLPNTLWGVHRCPERSAIFFSYVDPNVLRTTKMVSIDSQGQTKVLLGNRLLNEQSLVVDINSAGALSEAIAEIDEIKLCCKTFENEFCEVALKESSDICATCAQL